MSEFRKVCLNDLKFEHSEQQEEKENYIRFFKKLNGM